MAKSTVKFHCGCGFTCDNPLEAAIHVDSTGHTLDVTGIVKPDENKLKKPVHTRSIPTLLKEK